jgi:hypothetical protein
MMIQSLPHDFKLQPVVSRQYAEGHRRYQEDAPERIAVCRFHPKPGNRQKIPTIKAASHWLKRARRRLWPGYFVKSTVGATSLPGVD